MAKASTNGSTPTERLQQLDTLAREAGAHPDWVRERLTAELSGNRHFIRDIGAIDQILEGEHFWRKFHSQGLQDRLRHLTPWEAKIVNQYSAKSASSPAFSYDPQTSERIQSHLERRYRELHPEATLAERTDFWKRMAARGATGITDSMFAGLLAEAKEGQTTGRAEPGQLRELLPPHLTKAWFGTSDREPKCTRRALRSA